MKDVGRALTAGLRAPLTRWPLVLVLWLARLLPILLVFGLPLFLKVDQSLSHHPDATSLLDGQADESGFAYAWTTDFFRDTLTHASDTVFWLLLFCWGLVTVLAGGITARLLHGGKGLFLAECGRYAGRFLRLALFLAFLMYALDVGVNTLLARTHEEAAKLHHTQDFAFKKAWERGALFLTVLVILGTIHSYARIDIVANERRSAFVSFFRGFGILVTRFPKLFVLEAAMLLAAGFAILVAMLLTRAATPGPESLSWVGLAIFWVLAALGSYLRTGIELGTLEARCRLLAYQSETIPAPSPTPSPAPSPPLAPTPPDDEPDEIPLPPQAPET